jgi:hypothetical protein
MYTARRHAFVYRLDHHGDTTRLEHLIDRLGDLRGHSFLNRKRPTCTAMAIGCGVWEVGSLIGKLVSTRDDGYGSGWSRAAASVDDLAEDSDG